MAKSVFRKKKTDAELCEVIATSITDIVHCTLNPTFRQTYLDILQVTNSTDAKNSIENRLFNLLGVDKLNEEKCVDIVNNENTPIENYISLKILRSSDAMNTHKLEEMISLITYLLNVDSKLGRQLFTMKTKNFISTDVFSCSILENVESILKTEW